eukprot:6264357-Pyramimonas_sp.AAC.1
MSSPWPAAPTPSASAAGAAAAGPSGAGGRVADDADTDLEDGLLSSTSLRDARRSDKIAVGSLPS